MGDIVNLPVVTSLPIPVERILNGALESDLDLAIVVGVTKGGEFYFAASEADGGVNLWWLEIAKKKLLDIGDPDGR